MSNHTDHNASNINLEILNNNFNKKTKNSDERILNGRGRSRCKSSNKSNRNNHDEYKRSSSNTRGLSVSFSNIKRSRSRSPKKKFDASKPLKFSSQHREHQRNHMLDSHKKRSRSPFTRNRDYNQFYYEQHRVHTRSPNQPSYNYIDQNSHYYRQNEMRNGHRQYHEDTDRLKPQPNNVLAIFGLENKTKEGDLYKMFRKYHCKDCKMIYDKDKKSFRGFAFVYFDNLDDAVRAKEETNGRIIHEKQIRVDFSIGERDFYKPNGSYGAQSSAASSLSSHSSNYNRSSNLHRYNQNYIYENQNQDSYLSDPTDLVHLIRERSRSNDRYKDNNHHHNHDRHGRQHRHDRHANEHHRSNHRSFNSNSNNGYSNTGTHLHPILTKPHAIVSPIQLSHSSYHPYAPENTRVYPQQTRYKTNKDKSYYENNRLYNQELTSRRNN